MLALASFVVGCGGDMTRPAAAAKPAPSATLPQADGGAVAAARPDAAAPLTLDVVATRGPWLAPGMKEILRFETKEERTVGRDILRAPDRDTCARVAFAAGAVVHAWLEDASGASLSDGGRAASGVLGARGPVCVRRGDAIVLRIDAEVPTTIRIVAWGAP